MILSYPEIGEALERTLLADAEKAIPIRLVKSSAFLESPTTFVSKAEAAWLKASGWRAKAGTHALLPGKDGVAAVIFAMDDDETLSAAAMPLGALPAVLPQGCYRFEPHAVAGEAATLAWAMGAYSFRRYLSGEEGKECALVVPEGVDRARVIAHAQAIWFARELINLPANDLAPLELAGAMKSVGDHFGANVSFVAGEDLAADFPLVHTVGRSSERPACLADLVWGNKAHPKVTLVGKGVTFDTGGINVKPPQAMALMKKDMGGAATVMALGAMIMAARLPVRLRIIVPSADNNISANAFRPGDIIKSRAGLTVEIANTDAEGRLLLADALALADEEAPDLLIDVATLTGAARVALGPDLPAFFTEDDELAERLYQTGLATVDPLWRLPLWMPYDAYLKSKVANVNHVFNGPFAGAITAALFLKRFVKNAARYVHLDIFAWVPRAMPAKPAGGEPQGARALFEVISTIYGNARS